MQRRKRQGTSCRTPAGAAMQAAIETNVQRFRTLEG